jgi:hypothetical protein
VSGRLNVPATLPPGRLGGAQSQSACHGEVKILDLSIIQPTASCYTDYTTAVLLTGLANLLIMFVLDLVSIKKNKSTISFSADLSSCNCKRVAIASYFILFLLAGLTREIPLVYTAMVGMH